jgi:hypothetical protein
MVTQEAERKQIIKEALKAQSAIDHESVRLLTREQKEEALVKAAAAIAIIEELVPQFFTDEEQNEIFKPIDQFYAAVGVQANGR